MTAHAAVTDALGTVHPYAGENPRIVSFVPSLTELLCDLGLAGHIVGRTGFCIHPKTVVKRIRKVGGTKDVDVDAVRELAPTHAIVNIDENRRELADELARFVPHIVVTHPLSPDDNPPLYDMFGKLFGRHDRARELIRNFAAARARVGEFRSETAQRVLYLIWRDPWMTVSGDTYISRMLDLIGWRTEPDTAGARYPEIELADFTHSVDRVLLSSEPYPFRKKHLDEVSAHFPAGTPVSLVDGEMLSWYGSRAIAGLDYLASLSRQADPVAAQ